MWWRDRFACLTVTMVLTGCSGGAGSVSATTPPPVSSGTEWTRYVGAHYTNTPGSGLTRSWAGGGLRDPGGAGTNYKIAYNGTAYVDNGYSAFTTLAIPEIQSLLSAGRSAVVTIGGLSPSAASVFLDGMATVAGRDAYRAAIHNRVDAIAGLNISGWESKIQFQFGNEISNVNSTGFYGSICLWVTRNDPVPTATCDLVTQFIPTYVEYYLAPGIEALELKSQALFGRTDALQGMLGSIVNLSNRESFLYSLLEYQVVGTYAAGYAGKKVSALVESVSIHYTLTTPTWKTVLDNFYNQYLPGGVPTTRVRAIWSTEEGGVGTAEQGYGMATAMRVIPRYLSWWQTHNLSSDTGHVFFWGSDIKAPSGGTCTGCTSLDEDLPLFYSFIGDRALTEVTQNKSVLTVNGDFESYEFTVEGISRKVLVGFPPSNAAGATLTGLSLNLVAWVGRSATVTVWKIGNQGPQPVTVTPATVTAASATPVSLNLSLTGLEAVLILVDVP